MHEPLLDSAYKALEDNTASGYKMALIEASKIFDKLLAKKGYPGKDPLDRLYSASGALPNFEKIVAAEHKKLSVLNDVEYDLNAEFIKESLAQYAVAISVINTLSPLNIVKLQWIKLRGWYARKGFVKIAVVFFVFLGLVVFLSKTGPGLAFVANFLTLVDSIITWLFALGAFAIIAVAAFAFFEKKRK